MVDFRLSSKYAYSDNHQMTYFISRTFRKSGPYAKIPSTGQKHLYERLEDANFKHDNNFLNLKPKITQTRRFWFQV